MKNPKKTLNMLMYYTMHRKYMATEGLPKVRKDGQSLKSVDFENLLKGL